MPIVKAGVCASCRSFPSLGGEAPGRSLPRPADGLARRCLSSTPGRRIALLRRVFIPKLPHR